MRCEGRRSDCEGPKSAQGPRNSMVSGPSLSSHPHPIKVIRMPNTVTVSGLAQILALGCRYALSLFGLGARRGEQPEQPNVASKLVQDARTKRGEAFEADIVDQIHNAGLLVCDNAGRKMSPNFDAELLANVWSRFQDNGELENLVVHEPIVSTHSFTDKDILSERCKPDFVIFRRRTDGKISVFIIDAKHSSAVQEAHRIQVALYYAIIRDILKECDMSSNFALDVQGAVWIPDSGEAPILGLQMPGPTAFDVELVLSGISNIAARIDAAKESTHACMHSQCPECMAIGKLDTFAEFVKLSTGMSILDYDRVMDTQSRERDELEALNLSLKFEAMTAERAIVREDIASTSFPAQSLYYMLVSVIVDPRVPKKRMAGFAMRLIGHGLSNPELCTGKCELNQDVTLADFHYRVAVDFCNKFCALIAKMEDKCKNYRGSDAKTFTIFFATVHEREVVVESLVAILETNRQHPEYAKVALALRWLADGAQSIALHKPRGVTMVASGPLRGVRVACALSAYAQLFHSPSLCKSADSDLGKADVALGGDPVSRADVSQANLYMMLDARRTELDPLLLEHNNALHSVIKGIRDKASTLLTENGFPVGSTSTTENSSDFPSKARAVHFVWNESVLTMAAYRERVTARSRQEQLVDNTKHAALALIVETGTKRRDMKGWDTAEFETRFRLASISADHFPEKTRFQSFVIIPDTKEHLSNLRKDCNGPELPPTYGADVFNVDRDRVLTVHHCNFSLKDAKEGDRVILVPRSTDSTSKAIMESIKQTPKPTKWSPHNVFSLASAETPERLLDIETVTHADAGRQFSHVPDQLDGFNDSQVAGVKMVVRNKISVVYGPPGSGKTHFLGRMVNLLADLSVSHAPLCVLAVSNTNAAVDQFLVKVGEDDRRVSTCKVGSSRGGAPTVNKYKINYHVATECRKSGRKVVVVGCTLSMLLMIKELDEFDMVIIDEASQVLLTSAAKPLSFLRPDGRLVIAGDHQQLRAIVRGSYPVVDGVDLTMSLMASVMRVVAHPRVQMEPVVNRLFATGDSQRDPTVSTDWTKIPTAVMLSKNYRAVSELAEMLHFRYGARYEHAESSAASMFGIDNAAGKLAQLLRVEHPPALASDLGPALAKNKPLAIVTLRQAGRVTKHVGCKIEAENAAMLAAMFVAAKDDAKVQPCDLLIITPHHYQRLAVMGALEKIQKDFEGRVDLTCDMSTWVRTIDSVQGTDAKVVIFCMAIFDEDDVVSDASHVFSSERVNVAVSRVQSKLIILTTDAMVKPKSGALRTRAIEAGVKLFHHYVVRGTKDPDFTARITVPGETVPAVSQPTSTVPSQSSSQADAVDAPASAVAAVAAPPSPVGSDDTSETSSSVTDSELVVVSDDDEDIVPSSQDDTDKRPGDFLTRGPEKRMRMSPRQDM